MLPRDSFRVSKFSKTSSIFLRMVATSQGSGGIWEITLGEMAGVSMNRARDCSGERPMALPNMHSQMMLWNCSIKRKQHYTFSFEPTSHWVRVKLACD